MSDNKIKLWEYSPPTQYCPLLSLVKDGLDLVITVRSTGIADRVGPTATIVLSQDQITKFKEVINGL